MGHVVTLSWYEHQIAALCGVMRNVEALRNGWTRNYSKTVDDANVTNINAAGAEMAVAKFLNRYWVAGVNEFDAPDVSPNVEVRSTPYPHGKLIVRKDAPDDRPFVLVRGTLPNFEIVGWIRGGEAKRNEWLMDPNGDGECFMVPETALYVFERKEKRSDDASQNESTA